MKKLRLRLHNVISENSIHSQQFLTVHRHRDSFPNLSLSRSSSIFQSAAIERTHFVEQKLIPVANVWCSTMGIYTWTTPENAYHLHPPLILLFKAYIVDDSTEVPCALSTISLWYLNRAADAQKMMESASEAFNIPSFQGTAFHRSLCATILITTGIRFQCTSLWWWRSFGWLFFLLRKLVSIWHFIFPTRLLSRMERTHILNSIKICGTVKWRGGCIGPGERERGRCWGGGRGCDSGQI